MLENLKKEVFNANQLLSKYNLVTFSWGNVSGIDRMKDLIVVKPSDMEYDKLTPEEMPGILVCNHAPFTWGRSPADALHNAAVLEEIAFMAWHCLALPDKYLVPMQKDLLERHFNKKHGKDVLYGQNENENQVL
jgi:ribulose-5-phosphate 4-epimerase/fuculose-1-phosphate aldolase